MPSAKFLEPGTDATQDLSFFASSTIHSGTVASATDQKNTGTSSLKCVVSGTFGQAFVSTAAGTCSDLGRAISCYMRFSTVAPSIATELLCVMTSGGARATFDLVLDTTGKIGLKVDDSAAVALGSTALSANTWYRFSLAYSITSTSNWACKVYINGIQELSLTQTHGTLNSNNTNFVSFGLNDQINDPALMTVWIDDMYIDDRTDKSDTGDIHVTAKRPFANGSANNFVTQIGAGGSGYGTGHAPQVNERPLSQTNGWSVVAVATTVEEYNIESLSTGDVNLTGATLVSIFGWVFAKALISETATIIVDNGSTTNLALTSTPTLFTQISSTPTSYPAGTGTDIGMISSSTATTVSLYECGILVAYTPAASGSPFFSVEEFPAVSYSFYRNLTAAHIATRAQGEVWENPQPTRLNGKDIFFGVAGLAPTYDWPNPAKWRTASDKWPIDLRTFVGPIEIQLIGKDTFFGGAGKPPQHDPPQNPRGYPFPLDGRTEAQASAFQMLRDTFFGAAGEPPSQQPTPNPAGYRFSYELRTLLVNLLQGTLAANPIPFNLLEWPNPQGYKFPVADRNHTDASEFWMLQDTFFGAAGQPPTHTPDANPRGYPFPVDARTLLVNLVATTLGILPNPFFVTHWPNPRGYQYTQDLRTFVEGLAQINLNSGLKPLSTQSWPNPVLRPMTRGQVTDALNLLETTLGTSVAAILRRLLMGVGI